MENMIGNAMECGENVNEAVQTAAAAEGTGRVFVSVPDFRANATEADWDDLAETVRTAANKVEAFKNHPRYRFSYSSVAGLLKDHANDSAAAAGDAVEDFIIRSTPEAAAYKYVSRSVSVREDVLDRIDQLAAANPQYVKKTIITKLLEDGLARYGF